MLLGSIISLAPNRGKSDKAEPNKGGKTMKFYQDLSEEQKEDIFEGLKKDLKENAKAEGYPTTDEAMTEYVDNHINCNNTKESIKEWLELYWN